MHYKKIYTIGGEKVNSNSFDSKTGKRHTYLLYNETKK